MGGIVNVMGLPVNIMTENEFTSLMKTYVTNDYMNIIYMVSVDTYQALAGEPELSESMQIADLILPAERILMSSFHGRKIKGIVNSYRYLLYLLRKPDLIKKMCIIGNDNKSSLEMADFLGSQNPELEVCGVYSIEAGYNDETVINDINSKEPDILILTVDSPQLEHWILEHKSKIFVKVCVGLGNMSDVIVKENKSPANWIIRLGLDKLYYDIKNKKYSDNKKKERIMQSLIADYNSREK